MAQMLQAKAFADDFQLMFDDALQWYFLTPPQGNCLTIIVDLLQPGRHA
jgi:hypothetical protein